MKEKLKSLLADDAIYMALLVVGVGILAFILGRLSVIPTTQQNNITVNPLALCPTMVCATNEGALSEPAPAPVAVASGVSAPVVVPVTAPYVASKSSTKYHHISCPGAKQIKEENKIYFNSPQQAQAAGYSKAANCNY